MIDASTFFIGFGVGLVVCGLLMVAISLFGDRP